MKTMKPSTDEKTDQESQRKGSSKKPVGGHNKGKLPAGQVLTTLPLSKLRTHPLQAAYNPECSEDENAELATDLAANGQREAIQVLPAGNKAGLPAYTMLDGHRRHAALLANGKKAAKVVIRHDLRNADTTTVELVFLKFNHLRRHYDMLAFACNLVRQREIVDDRNYGRISGVEFYNVAKILAAMHGISLRNAQRYVHVACTPIEIQNAHRQGHLSLSLAARVDGLTKEVQATIAQRITEETNTTKITSIVQEYLSPRFSYRPKRYTPVAIQLIKKLEQAVAHYEINYAQLHGPTLKPFLPVLTELKMLVDKLMIAAEQPGGSLEGVLQNIAPLISAAGLQS